MWTNKCPQQVLYVNKTEVKAGPPFTPCSVVSCWTHRLFQVVTAMPQLSAAAVLQLALLLAAVPAQYYITQWSGSDAGQRYQDTKRLIMIWRDWGKSYLSATAWMDWTNQQMSHIKSFFGMEPEETVNSPSYDSMIYDNDEGFFGASKTTRSPRPPYVFLRVGEVVMERNAHMVGVVVSWDSELRAPPEWVEKMHSNFEYVASEKTPHYKVLFQGPGPTSVLIAYLPQTQLHRVSGTRPEIVTLEKYFTHFDGERFVMQPWLKEMFPEDDVKNDEL